MTAELICKEEATHVELVLNRPGRRNALSRSLLAALDESLHRADRRPEVRSVILTGAPPAFCAGLDLDELPPAGERGDNTPLLNVCETIEGLSKPVIAAVNGPAVAGGAALVTACDVVVMAASAFLAWPGVRRGLVAPLVMTYLARCVGERQAKYLLLTGAPLPARRAGELGLANAVVPDEEVLPWAREQAAEMARVPARALAETKALWQACRPEAERTGARRRRDAELWRFAPEAHEAGP